MQDNHIEIQRTHMEEQSVVANRFIEKLKNKTWGTSKYIISISNILYIDKLEDIVNKYNNTYHKKIKMKSINVKSSTYICRK